MKLQIGRTLIGMEATDACCIHRVANQWPTTHNKASINVNIVRFTTESRISMAQQKLNLKKLRYMQH